MHACLQGPAGGASPGINGWTVAGWDVRQHMNLEQSPTVTVASRTLLAANTAATQSANTDQDCLFLSCISKMCIDAV